MDTSTAGMAPHKRADQQRPLRIAVIGSSYIGALLRAYKAGSVPDGFTFGFFGSPSPTFGRIRVEAGHVVGAEYVEAPGTDIGGYDAFVIYGDFWAMHDVAKTEEVLAAALYSRQVMDATVRDMLQRTHTVELCRTLHAATGARPYFLSLVAFQTVGAMPSGFDRDRALGYVRDFAPSGRYIEYPREMYDDDMAPKPEFYRGSALLHGGLGRSPASQQNDRNHLNEHGGALLLERICSRIVADRMVGSETAQ